jgi:hypothetical protein
VISEATVGGQRNQPCEKQNSCRVGVTKSPCGAQVQPLGGSAMLLVGDIFLRALGMKSIVLPCERIRDHIIELAQNNDFPSSHGCKPRQLV